MRNNIYWNPVIPQKQIKNFTDDLFGRSISEIIGQDLSLTSPSVNILDSDAVFTIQLAAPGLDKTDFNIVNEKEQLIISAKKTNEEIKEVDGKFTRKEFDFTSFSKSFKLPKLAVKENITANYENGILYVTIPKSEKVESEKVKTIEIS